MENEINRLEGNPLIKIDINLEDKKEVVESLRDKFTNMYKSKIKAMGPYCWKTIKSKDSSVASLEQNTKISRNMS